MLCYFFPEPSYLFFTTDVPDLLYYSHIPSMALALLVGLFVYFNARHLLLNKLLLIISICFSLWTTFNLFAWTNIHADFLLFIWPLFGILSAFISIYSIYFIYVFLNKKDAPNKLKLLFLILLAPTLIFGATNLNLTGFNISNCDAFGYEGLIYKFYYIFLGVVGMISIIPLLISSYKKADKDFKKQILLMGVGIEFFLFSFFVMTFLASYIAGIGVWEDSRLEFYGLFGMTVFMIFIGVLIVKFKTFSIGMVASQALLIFLLILVGSQYTYSDNINSSILTSVTLAITALIGAMLIKSVGKEIQQRVRIQGLATELESANDRLKELDKLKSEFVSIASHQLRSPLTSIRGYASLLLDGSYGKIPSQAIVPLTRIDESSKLMAMSIEDYLNVSRIESGNMKYNKADFNLKDEVEHVCDGLRNEAVKKGLGLIFRSDLKSRGVINADIGKTVQIINNLINNSIKYTPTGSIKVLVRDDVVRKKIFVDIMDTGIGMSEKTQKSIFQKFERAENANTVNTSGTGLGLYVAHKMAEGMGGDITAYSEGDGKGSRFTLELPLAL